MSASNYNPQIVPGNPAAAWCGRCLNRLLQDPNHVCVGTGNNIVCSYCAAGHHECLMVGSGLVFWLPAWLTVLRLILGSTKLRMPS